MPIIIDRINSPDDLKKLNDRELELLAGEIRELLIETVSKNGGHLASNLGSVELTMVLHKIFDLPEDHIIWDVGHQCYTHKILTGRKKEFETLRQEGGVAGFPRPEESVYDTFISGHSSTSISAALGLAKADALNGRDNYTVAVIGDGALTGGLAYEGLNNAVQHNLKMMIVLNDNGVSISKNVGGIAKHLLKIRTKPWYFRFKDRVERIVTAIPFIGKKIRNLLFHTKQLFKYAIYDTSFFEDLGYVYMGPVDGHNLKQLTDTFLRAKEIGKPCVIHVATQKGKGYPKAEENPGAYHGVSKFDVEAGNPDILLDNSFSAVFGKKLAKLAQKDRKICGITAAMKYGTGLNYLKSVAPSRFFDVGIAEQHAVVFGAGLAKGGYKPVFAVYSSFLQRAYDQLLHDVALQNIPMLFAVDRSGVVGEDGETHQGIFDVAFLRSLPNFKIYSPANYAELEYRLEKELSELDSPVAVRYPRGKESTLIENEPYFDDITLLPAGNENADILLIAYGREFASVLSARKMLLEKGIFCDILKLNRVFPIDISVFTTISEYKSVFLFEEGIESDGIGEYIADNLFRLNFQGNYSHFGIKNGIVHHGKMEVLLKSLKLDDVSVAKTVEERFNETR